MSSLCEMRTLAEKNIKQVESEKNIKQQKMDEVASGKQERKKRAINADERKKRTNIYRNGIEVEVSNSDNGPCSLFLCHQRMRA